MRQLGKGSLLLLLIGALLCFGASAAKPSTNKLVETIQKKKYDAFIKELSATDMDPNQPDSKGRLPLFEAVKTKDIRFVDALVQFGALTNTKDPATHASPLQFAFQNSLVEIAKVLLAYGADPNVKDKSGARPRDFTPVKEVAALVKKWDEEGAAGFEDPPGTWVKAKSDKGEQYWFNVKTEEARWNTPPSCAWQRVLHHGQASQYINAITSQETYKRPAALCWRLVRKDDQDMWFNWRVNISQLDKPDELPADMLQEAERMKNVRWWNPQTEEFSWEDPLHLTPWRQMADEDGGVYYYNIVTGNTQWEVPTELAWQRTTSEEHEGRDFWHNTVTGEVTWEAPGHHAWEKHEDDL